MRRIKTDDTRQQAEEKFDSCMDDLFVLAGRYVGDVKHILDSDEDNVKILSHSFSLESDLRLIAENTNAYSVFIHNSLYHDRTEVHERLSRKLRYELADFRAIVNQLGKEEIGASDAQDSNITFVPCVQQENIANALMTNSCSIISQIAGHLDTIEETVNKLIPLREQRTDGDYEDIYRQMKDCYYSSEEWRDIADGYINQLYHVKFRRQKPNVVDLEVIYADLYVELSNDKDVGAVWSSTIDNDTKRARRLESKNFATEKEIQQIFHLEGKMEIIDDWIKEIMLEDSCYECVEEETKLTEVVFCNDWTEEWFREKWDAIKGYMDERRPPQYAWCCLHHTLTYYNIIEKTEFAFFMRWLNQFCGEELITDGNIRQVKNYYFVKTVSTIWRLEDLLKEKNSKQKETEYRRYCEYCDDILEILRGR